MSPFRYPLSCQEGYNGALYLCAIQCVSLLSAWLLPFVVIDITTGQAVWHSESSSRQTAERGAKVFALEAITQPCSQSTGHRKRWKGVEQGGPTLIITRLRPDLCPAPAVACCLPAASPSPSLPPPATRPGHGWQGTQTECGGAGPAAAKSEGCGVE